MPHGIHTVHKVSTNPSRVNRSGYSRAALKAMTPPQSWPTNEHWLMPRASMKSTMSRAKRSRVTRTRGLSVPPYPRVSGAYTR